MNETSKLWRTLTPDERALFKGKGIDIGCGNDPIMTDTRPFDRQHGDANRITDHVLDTFDYVFSSHCLEHMCDPRDALKEWWKLVKPGGHLIFVVPDEDLYEQGVFPSRFNSDHKATFTISKRESWSSRSFNVLELVQTLDNARLVKCELQDCGYDYTKLNHGLKSICRPICRVVRLCRILRIRAEWARWLQNKAVIYDQTSQSAALAQIMCIVQKTLA